MRLTLPIMIFLLSVSVLLNAHPASKIDLEYDNETELLTVSFVHKVSDRTDHFIYEIEIELNKKTVIEQEVRVQDTTDGGTFVYKIPGLNSGDEIKVTSNCNKGGKKSTVLELE